MMPTTLFNGASNDAMMGGHAEQRNLLSCTFAERPTLPAGNCELTDRDQAGNHGCGRWNVPERQPANRDGVSRLLRSSVSNAREIQGRWFCLVDGRLDGWPIWIARSGN